jgi:hypothetical protein
MRHHRVVGSIVAVVWISIANSADAQNPSATYLFGAEVIAVPTPAGYENVSPADLISGDLAVSIRSADTLALFGAIDSSGGQPGQRRSFALVVTPGDLRGIDVDVAYFGALATGVRTGLDENLRKLKPDLATVASDLEKRIQVAVEIQQPTVIGVFDDAADRIGILQVMPVVIGGITSPILSANTIIRVRSRILFAYVYAMNAQPESVSGLASVARSWTDAIIAANAKSSQR